MKHVSETVTVFGTSKAVTEASPLKLGQTGKQALLLIRPLITGLSVGTIAAYMFYRNVWGLLPGVGVAVYVFVSGRKRVLRKRRMERLDDYRNLITALSGALAAGGSLSRAFCETERDLGFLYGEKAEIRQVLREIQKRQEMGETFSGAFRDYAKRSALPEIRDFAEMLTLAEETGGDMLRIIRRTVEKITTKIELRLEVERMVAAKRLEQKVMTLMPAGILFFLLLTAPDFTAALYHGAGGRLVMTAALGMNILADFWGERIVEGTAA